MAKTAEWLQTHYNAASKLKARNTHETKTINRDSSGDDASSATHTHEINTTDNMILDRTLKSK